MQDKPALHALPCHRGIISTTFLRECQVNRWQAFAIHFAISAVIFIVLLAIILLFWFPGILFQIDGGWTGLQIVIGVDLVLGPLLTLIIFKVDKPSLKFDLTCIGLLQALCLAGGVYIVHAERPVALVLAYDTVYALAADEFLDFDRDPAVLEQFAGSYPKFVYTELPENHVGAEIEVIRSQVFGNPLFMQTERYRLLPESNFAKFFSRSDSLLALLAEDFVEQLPENCLFSRFTSALTSGYLCVDAVTRELTDFFTEDEVRFSAQTGS